MAIDPQRVLDGFRDIWQLRSPEDVNSFLNGQGTPPGLLSAADAAMNGNLPFSPSPTSSPYQNFIDSGMPWQQASDAATAESMMTMHAKNEAVKKTIQTDQKGRAQQAARNMLEIFPEFTFNAQPLPPYSDALTEFARSFGVSPKAILDEINDIKNKAKGPKETQQETADEPPPEARSQSDRELGGSEDDWEYLNVPGVDPNANIAGVPDAQLVDDPGVGFTESFISEEEPPVEVPPVEVPFDVSPVPDPRSNPEKEMDPYSVFSGYENPAGAIFESVLRQKLGRRAYNPRILDTGMRGTSHALGSWFLRQLDIDKNYDKLTFYNYLSEDDPSLYRSTPAMSRQSYERIVRAARAAYTETDEGSLTWASGEEMPDFYASGKEGPVPADQEQVYKRLVGIGQLVRNPTYSKSVAMAQAGITGEGIMGALQMKGIDGLYNRWQNEQVADPSQERRTFLAFLSTLKNTPWYVEPSEGTDTKSDLGTTY